MRISSIMCTLFILTLFCFSLTNVFVSQNIHPLFIHIVTEGDQKIAVQFMHKIENTSSFFPQLVYFNSMFGPDFKKQLYKSKDERKQQIYDYTQLLTKNPNARDVLLKLAMLYYNDKNLPQAQNYYQQAKKIDPWISISELEKLNLM